MSRPRLLADHDLNEHIVTGVLRREPSLEWIRVRDVGLSDRADAEVLAYAADHGYIVVSHDVNTMPSTAYDRMHAGQKMSGLRILVDSSSSSLAPPLPRRLTWAPLWAATTWNPS